MEQKAKWMGNTVAYLIAVTLVSASATAQAPDEAIPRQKCALKPHLSPQAIQATFLKGQMLWMQKAAGSAKDVAIDWRLPRI